ncbi:MAG: hypothetical protein ACRDV1_02315 [Actinomycetes bacterium]
MPRRHRFMIVLLALGLSGGLTGLLADHARGAVPDAPGCSAAGTWRQGELNVYWFDVEQGDAQLVVGPTGRTLLIDLGENAWNSSGLNTNATQIAAEIRGICGIASGPVHLDYVMASHHHLDHIGYAGNPNDTTAYGNGLYQLLSPGGLGFTVGQLIDHDGGTWTDTNGDTDCDVGTSAAPAEEIDWNNAGTVSGTSRRWVCWLYGPANQADRAHIAGKVLRLTNGTAWPALDLGAGVTAAIVEANAKDVMQADGTTPVSGDHTASPTPPSENDYSIALRIAFGPYAYATAGDSDGEYATSANGYTYNDVEALLTARFGKVATARANHHGSEHASSTSYLAGLDPQTGVISCGVNSYGHPGNSVLNNFRAAGADIYLTNNPCDDVDDTGAAIDYSGTYNRNGSIHLATTDGGSGFTVDHDGGTRTYATETGGAAGDPSQVRVNEFLMAPSGAGTEWVELHNPTGIAVEIGGLYIDDIAAGGGSPKQIPAGTVVAAGGRYVMDVGTGFLNNTGSDTVRFLAVNAGAETMHDSYTYSLPSPRYDQVFHRIGDGGAWCATISTDVTKGTANPGTCP